MKNKNNITQAIDDKLKNIRRYDYLRYLRLLQIKVKELKEGVKDGVKSYSVKC
jgi:hypothetical protein